MIKSAPRLVYDSVINVNHTGDVNWQTGLNISGKGKAEIHFSGDTGSANAEIRVTPDGNVLANGIIGQSRGYHIYEFTLEWNKTLLVEYRTNAGGATSYVAIHYYNR